MAVCEVLEQKNNKPERIFWETQNRKETAEADITIRTIIFCVLLFLYDHSSYCLRMSYTYVYDVIWPNPFPHLRFLLPYPSPLSPPNSTCFLLLLFSSLLHLVLAVCAWALVHLPQPGGASQGTQPQRELILSVSHSQQLSIAPQTGWGFTGPSPIHTGMLPGLIFLRSRASSPIYGELTCATALSIPANTV